MGEEWERRREAGGDETRDTVEQRKPRDAKDREREREMRYKQEEEEAKMGPERRPEDSA